MNLAIISDIHGNLPALEAVLGSTVEMEVEEVWCLGDVVGYGADPDGCARTVSERCSLCLVGNHDLAVLGEIEIGKFSPAAAAAVEWTQANSAAETLEFLRSLEAEDTSREIGLYHASPRDPVWEYVLWPDQAADCIASQARRVSMIGHSHVALFFTLPEETANTGGDGDETAELTTNAEARGAQAGGGTSLDVSEGRWLINPGSVGQPRDGDPRAAWLQIDTEGWVATYHRIPYDIDRAAEAIVDADLPPHLAKRLYMGQ